MLTAQIILTTFCLALLSPWIYRSVMARLLWPGEFLNVPQAAAGLYNPLGGLGDERAAPAVRCDAPSKPGAP